MKNTTTKRRSNQLERILKFLETGSDLTVAIAESKLGVKRLSARVSELRDLGFKVLVDKKTVRGSKRRVTAYTFGESAR